MANIRFRPGLRVAVALLTASAVTTATAAAPGQPLFARKCGICHAAGGTGAIMLGLRLGKDRAVLAQRTDLAPAYVRAVVRTGLRSMPPLSRVEVTDQELETIVAFLAPPAAPAPDNTP